MEKEFWQQTRVIQPAGSDLILLVADVLLSFFHALFTLFNLTGWIWSSTRVWHRISITTTLFSWLILGYFYGWGYCFLTDWHYQILANRGLTDLPTSYITFMVERGTGWRPSDDIVILLTAILFAIVSLITYTLWGLEYFKDQKNKSS